MDIQRVEYWRRKVSERGISAKRYISGWTEWTHDTKRTHKDRGLKGRSGYVEDLPGWGERGCCQAGVRPRIETVSETSRRAKSARDGHEDRSAPFGHERGRRKFGQT